MLDSYHTSHVSREHIADFIAGRNQVENDTGNVSRSIVSNTLIRPSSEIPPVYCRKLSKQITDTIVHPELGSEPFFLRCPQLRDPDPQAHANKMEGCTQTSGPLGSGQSLLTHPPFPPYRGEVWPLRLAEKEAPHRPRSSLTRPRPRPNPRSAWPLGSQGNRR
ncbi:hypothetical protein F2Q69_00047704 [Brassica cretica]|uniref:Uncharacterized protein n=1 Tax=Brassica cretica TaxID=69181 RepID=A0A8S9PVA1_BRACR|nr:hypothetical protein F2Q69_00047704 [Brassica cretica]